MSIDFKAFASQTELMRNLGISQTDAAELVEAYESAKASEQPDENTLIAVLKDARETIDMLHQHGNFDNGVYDPTGSICEGVVMTDRYVKRALDTIDAAFASTKREIVDDELLNEAEYLIRKAKDAARKLNTMYLRHEVEPRSELDGLIGVKEKLTAWIYKRRGMAYEIEVPK